MAFAPPHNTLDKEVKSNFPAEYIKANLFDKQSSKQQPETNLRGRDTTPPSYTTGLSFILENRSALAYDPNQTPPSIVERKSPGRVATGQSVSSRSSGQSSDTIPGRTRDKPRRVSGLQYLILASKIGMVKMPKRLKAKGGRSPPGKRRDTLYCLLPGAEWVPV